MWRETTVSQEAGPDGSSPQDRAAIRPGPCTFLLLSLWCGLVAGLLEVGVTVLRKQTLDQSYFTMMSRHFVWLVPLTDLAIFFGVGVLLSLLILCGRRGRWLAPRLLCTLTLLPPLWAASTRIIGPAGLLLAMGAAVQVVPALERRSAGLRRLVRLSFPAAIGLVMILAVSLWGQDRVKEWREARQPLPPPGSPNVLLIVLDTVAADHLSLFGYNRPTSPTIDELANLGIRFDRAQATSSWTLPSHASLFTGRWPHELSTGWVSPLDRTYPTLAGFLGEHGYATAGFTANYWYCASNSGLDRGFTVYRDYIFPRLTAFKPAVLINRPLAGLQVLEQFLEDWLDIDLLRPTVTRLVRLFRSNRKGAAVVNRELLDWLSRRQQPERPFFAFLNYYDAHHPYQPPEMGIRRFWSQPEEDREIDPFEDPFDLLRRRLSQQQVAMLRDAYDSCVADLDEKLGQLIDELERRAILERTWVIVVADHGESFGEHPGVFLHGTSLYQTELHVPLLIVPPASARNLSRRIVTEPVSLRDLAATIVGELGFPKESPFPGESLIRFGSRSALSEVVPFDVLNPDLDQFLKPRWPMSAMVEGEWTFIRREGDVREELFHLRDDAQEQHNRADEPAMQPTLERMRQALGGLTAGPLTPQRFNP